MVPANQTNVNFYVFGGYSRSNASTKVIDNNASAITGLTYDVDASLGAILVMVPVIN